MTGTAHEDGSEKLDGRVLKFPSTSPNDLGVTVYEPSAEVPVAELKRLKIRISYATGKHWAASSYLNSFCWFVFGGANDAPAPLGD